ncbi:L domain-like protein [Gigaspora margarita]|uniref:L domain-like protein n=1 Tax=Gigaspora margarita TaxID=4874 RepID=A0A8H4AY74_GIGMA|nr:L domain-like protein [Gigaspora margarita]
MSRQLSPPQYKHVRNESSDSIATSRFSLDSEDSDNGKGSNKRSPFKVVNARKTDYKVNNKRVNSIVPEYYYADDNGIPIKQKSFNEMKNSQKNNERSCFSKLAFWKKKDNNKELPPPTTTKDKKERRRCCTTILLIILILLLLIILGNLLALDILFPKLQQMIIPSSSGINNTAPSQLDLRIKTITCLTLFSAIGSTQPKQYPCEYCANDPNAFYNVTTFCALKGIWANIVNKTDIETNLKWMVDNNFCQWIGVKCDSSNNIISLELNSPNIPNTLSNDIGKLTTLQNLAIAGSTTIPNGTIPTSLFQLPNLNSLKITSTSLTGPIPDTFNKMPALKTLNLQSNPQLGKTIPPSIGSLSLNALIINGQGISGPIPDFIGNSNTLQKSLQTLDLNSNALTGSIPASLMQLSNLKTLVLGINQLSGSIPTTISSAKFQKTITQLDLGNNTLTGTIPDSLSQLPNLQFLYLGNNQFNGQIPASLATLANLKELLLNNNKLSGNIPDALGNITLTRLLLTGNTLTGAVPNSICQKTFSTCDLTGNNLTASTKCVSCTV